MRTSETTEVAYTFEPLSVADAEAIAAWRYPDEWSAYDIPTSERESSVLYMSDPKNGYFAIRRGGELIGFCSVGPDGQVAGGRYDASALDVGAGLRPDLVGQRRGADFLREVISFLRSRHDQVPLRATIASWNGRALRAAQSVGFVPHSSFVNPDGREFTILVLQRL